MKKIILLAALVVASTALYAAPSKKKKKEVAAAKVEKPVELISASDSLSYAAGKFMSRGLLEYLQRNLQVDTAYLADFITGFREAMEKTGDPKYTAMNAGRTIAQQVDKQMLPTVLKQFEGTEHTIDARLLHEGFLSGVLADTTIMTEPHAVTLFKATSEADEKKKNEAYKTANEAWLNENKTKEGVQTLPSGLQYEVLESGKGDSPKASDNVEVHYTGKLIDGTVFDSSVERGVPASFGVTQVIPGWVEALQLMHEGDKWRLYIPSDLAYGPNGAGGVIGPNMTLIFDVELLRVIKK